MAMRLRRPCEHGYYDAHYLLTLEGDCPGGEFLADDTLVIEKLDAALRVISQHFASALIPVRSEMRAGDLVAVCDAHARQVLDAVAVREGEG